MSAPLITTKNLYLQKEFSEQTEAWLRLAYGVAEDEELLCAVWVSPWTRCGFLVTDEAVRWSVAGNDGAKANGALLKDVNPAADFTITPAVSDANAAQSSKAKTAAEELSRLEITADGKTFTFFVKGLTAEKGKTLCDILRFGYTQGEVPQTDLGAFVKPMPLLAVRNFLDGDLVFFSSVADKILGIAKAEKQAADKETPADEAQKESAETAATASATPDDATEKADSADQTDAQTKSAQPKTATVTESVSPPQMSFGDRVRSALLAVLDVCASLIFIAAVVIAIKPQILPFAENKTIPDSFTYFEKIGDYVLKIDVTKNPISESLEMWRNVFVILGLLFYTFFKVIVLVFSKATGRKIVSVLLIIMTLLAVFLAVDKFLLFIPFCLLLYFAFEYSCELRTKSIFAKLVVLLVLGYIGYVTAHIVLIPENTDAFKQIIAHVHSIRETLPINIIWW